MEGIQVETIVIDWAGQFGGGSSSKDKFHIDNSILQIDSITAFDYHCVALYIKARSIFHAKIVFSLKIKLNRGLLLDFLQNYSLVTLPIIEVQIIPFFFLNIGNLKL